MGELAPVGQPNVKRTAGDLGTTSAQMRHDGWVSLGQGAALLVAGGAVSALGHPYVGAPIAIAGTLRGINGLAKLMGWQIGKALSRSLDIPDS